ncbi:solute carrier family 25 member 35-like [Achlya hypogyna]|uniref:Solute carrier family 25 member 35-like n=1 Tax=Achlya hypogyna TaxID=1202772 RepID=A0A1V9YJX5_ACHHY|nr:solute carrier family 25 member 35-like [Achlya hypogyna]
MEVVKTRMQLQGELATRARGSNAIFYRNFAHAFYLIARTEGVVGIQRGLGAGMAYNAIMNGIRLGSFESFQHLLGASDPTEPFYMPRNAVAGVLGGIVGAPFYLVKTRLQAQSSITALNAQYHYSSMVGSGAQLASYSSAKHFVVSTLELPPTSVWPFDVVATRLASQKVNHLGQGVLYSGVVDCFRKTLAAEGVVHGLYKGWAAGYIRAAPHTMLSFLLWEQFKDAATAWGY